MSLAESPRPALAADVVQATINYLGPMHERPLFHAQDHRRDNLRYDSHAMPIQDARRLAEPPSLEREGIRLCRHASAVRDFHDPQEVRSVYLPEVEGLIRRLTGADRVVVLSAGALVRYAERSPRFGTGMNTQPARFPHIDFTRDSAPGLVDSMFGASGAALKPGQPLVGYNIWRVITPPPQDTPLAVCDRRTVAADDLVRADGVYDEGDPETWPTSEAYLLRHSRAHRWIWFRDMQLDEALVFRAYDNDPVERPCVPHTAFDDPTCPPGAIARESMEARAFAVFDR
jgi:hypothetical protein